MNYVQKDCNRCILKGSVYGRLRTISTDIIGDGTRVDLAYLYTLDLSFHASNQRKTYGTHSFSLKKTFHEKKVADCTLLKKWFLLASIL